jgi:hypothetical protein
VKTWIIVALLLGSTNALSAKGMGVGVHVRGMVSGVRTIGEAVEFQVGGSLELTKAYSCCWSADFLLLRDDR